MSWINSILAHLIFSKQKLGVEIDFLKGLILTKQNDFCQKLAQTYLIFLQFPNDKGITN